MPKMKTNSGAKKRFALTSHRFGCQCGRKQR